MAVVARKHKKSVVYWAVFPWEGKRVWERSGTDKRACERLEKQRKREVKEGTYRPEEASDAITVGQWLATFFRQRRNRNVDDDRAAIKNHVEHRDWLVNLALVDARRKHANKFVDELEAEARLGPKSVANVYGLVHRAFEGAVDDELIPSNSFTVKKGRLGRRRGKSREPYTAEEIVALCTSPNLPDAQKMFDALAFFTGMREGEICGRRWRDIDHKTQPLKCLHVRSQYRDRVLKTERTEGEAPREVPIHRILEGMLDAWWRIGWEIYQCRKPTPDDFIVPNRDGSAHTKSSAYKAWRRACTAAGVTNRTLHSTRHSFITHCRRGGCNVDALEKITHNAKGDVIDGYTHWEWEPACEVVQCLDVALRGLVDSPVDSSAKLSSNIGGGAGNRSRENSRATAALPEHPRSDTGRSSRGVLSKNSRSDADRDAGQRPGVAGCLFCHGTGEEVVRQSQATPLGVAWVEAVYSCPCVTKRGAA